MEAVTKLALALKARGIVVEGVSPDGAGWKVFPANMQTAAQPIIDAFDPNDPAYATAEKDGDTDQALRPVLDALLLAWCERLPSVVTVVPGYTPRQFAESIRGRVIELRRAPNNRPKPE